MINKIALVVLLGGSSFAYADMSQQELAVGKWTIAPEWQQRFSPECRSMTIEFTRDQKIIRTTGELEYSSQAEFTKVGDKIRIDEKLIDSNLKLSCGHKHAETVIGHLNQSAYFSVSQDRLYYYRSDKEKSLVVFSRTK